MEQNSPETHAPLRVEQYFTKAPKQYNRDTVMTLTSHHMQKSDLNVKAKTIKNLKKIKKKRRKEYLHELQVGKGFCH